MALVVRLANLDLEAEAAGELLEPVRNVVERLGTIDFRLPHAEQVEVRAVQHIDCRWRRHGGTL